MSQDWVRFNRLTSHIAAWVDVGLFALLVPVMWWRIAVWIRIHRDKDSTTAAEEDGVA